MAGLGFPRVFTASIMEFVSSVSYSISLNGDLHGLFFCKRGIQQGDPLSPYLFMMAMEYLSRMIKISTANPNFNFHHKCSKLGITHLTFANDLILFSRDDAESVRIIMLTLQQFGLVSGLETNLSKSRIFAIGVTNEEYSILQGITRFPQGDFPVRYLGVPLTHGKLKSTYFAPLIEKISSHIRDWAMSTLSYAGKLELIVVVVQRIESFRLHAFPLPTSILEKTNKLCRNFLYATSSVKVAWHNICLPKVEGGLGLKNCKVWNKPILMKVLWNIQANKDTLWIKWVHEVYLHGINV